MADDEQSTSGMVSGLTQVFVAQLRAVTEGLENLAGIGERLPAARGPLPLPGALSAAQVTSIEDSVAAQRRSIEALKAQLSAFDEQLAVLEQILGPLAEWSRMWADLEEQLVTMRRRPKAEDALLPHPFQVGLIRRGDFTFFRRCPVVQFLRKIPSMGNAMAPWFQDMGTFAPTEIACYQAEVDM